MCTATIEAVDVECGSFCPSFEAWESRLKTCDSESAVYDRLISFSSQNCERTEK